MPDAIHIQITHVTMNFTIHLGKIKCELSLTEKEAATARRSVYRYLKHLSKEWVQHENNDGSVSYSRNKITSLQLGQYLDIDATITALEGHQHHMIQAAPLSLIVEAINKNNLLPTIGEKFNFEAFVYEIFDQMFRDYVVLISPELSIPSGSDVRIKNSLNIFSYTRCRASVELSNHTTNQACARPVVTDKNEIERIRKLLDSLANDSLYRQLDLSHKAQTNLEHLWCLVTCVYDCEQQGPVRHLCHEHVCVSYVTALQNNRMFYKACIDYPQFNLVHSKIMQITERMMRRSIPLTLSLCGLEQCHTSMADIRAARLVFKQRQRQMN